MLSNKGLTEEGSSRLGYIGFEKGSGKWFPRYDEHQTVEPHTHVWIKSGMCLLSGNTRPCGMVGWFAQTSKVSDFIRHVLLV